jgi:cytochrome c oxidase cbb3-type subunit 3
MSSRVEWLVGAATAVALVTGISATSRRDTAPPLEKVLAVCAALPCAAQQIGPTPGPGADTLAEPKNPYTGNAAAIREGRRLFNWYNCSGCHGDHAGGGMGPSLRDSTWVYGGSDARIYRSIAQGRTKGMPSWGTTLPAEQIWKIVAYIKTLRTSREPDKPTP